MDQIQEIKERLDIADVVSEYVKLKKSGRNYFGLCPFHNEKTASFSVNSELGIFKCFGCGESGDVLTFIEKIENADFPQALEIAAKKAGIELKPFKSQRSSKFDLEKKKLMQVNQFTATFYNYILSKHKAGSVGATYLKNRKISDKSIEKFVIGYAPSGYENLKKVLIKRNYSPKNLVKWGILVDRNGRTIDKFRDRIIFSIHNEFGEIVGFSGRTTTPNFKGPKYLNSPETIVFKKSRLLFGLYQAKASIRKAGFVIFTEGQMDVISSNQSGVENIVAPLGTALTELQLDLVKRYTKKVYFAFDTDEAGEKAALKAFLLSSRKGLDPYGISLGKYQDADEMIRDNPKLWAKSVTKPIDMVSYLIDRLSNRLDLNSLEGKMEIASIILPIIKGIPDEIKKNYYLLELSNNMDVDMQVLIKEMSNVKKENLKTVSEREKVAVGKIVAKSNSREDYLISIFLQYFPKVKRLIKLVDEDIIVEQLNREILVALKKYILDIKDSSIKTFIASLPQEISEKAKTLALNKIPDLTDTLELKQEIEQTIQMIQNDDIKRKVDILHKEIRKAESSNDDELAKELTKKLDALLKIKRN